MTHLAVALAQQSGAWTGWELDVLADDDLDALGERIVDEAEGAELALLLLEENDEWFAVIRWDDLAGGPLDPRVYVSDRRVVEDSELARRLLADALPVPVPSDTDEDAGRPEIEPAGDVALLEDLGVPGDRLVDLTVEEGMLPVDTLTALAEAAGAAEALESARLG